MTKEFYEEVIDNAEDLGQLRVIHKFLVCDLRIYGDVYKYLSSLISKKESFILLDMQKSTKVFR